jgi:effector-binding domain-containing protein
MERIAIWLGLGFGVLALGVTGAWVAAAQSVETPAYAVELRDGAMEIRTYPALVAAEVRRPGSRQEAAQAAFSPLARYIFARDRPGGKIAMTAPVTQNRDEGAWTVRFLMPKDLGIAALPAPAGDVQLAEIPAGRLAAIRFSGRWTDVNFTAAEARLRTWLAARGLTAVGPATFAYYNDPFTPWFLRRNEVHLRLAD